MENQFTQYAELSDIPKNFWVARDIQNQVYPLINYPVVYRTKPDFEETEEGVYGCYYYGDSVGYIQNESCIEQGSCVQIS